jgi:hypothetical protein
MKKTVKRQLILSIFLPGISACVEYSVNDNNSFLFIKRVDNDEWESSQSNPL